MTDEETPAPESPEAVRELARAARTGHAPDTRELTGLDRVALSDYAQDVRLKRTYALGLLSILLGQLTIANLGFFFYGFFGVNWDITPSVMHVWLSATVVEVVGIIFVVTRYLFPRRDFPGGG